MFLLSRPAPHRAADPRQENCFRGGIKSRIAARSQSCTASRGYFVAIAAGLRRFSGGEDRHPALQPGPGIVGPRARNLARRSFDTGKCSGLRNTLTVPANKLAQGAPRNRPPRVGCVSGGPVGVPPGTSAAHTERPQALFAFASTVLLASDALPLPGIASRAVLKSMIVCACFPDLVNPNTLIDLTSLPL